MSEKDIKVDVPKGHYTKKDVQEMFLKEFGMSYEDSEKMFVYKESGDRRWSESELLKD